LFLRNGLGRARQRGGKRRDYKGRDCAHGRSLTEVRTRLELLRKALAIRLPGP
jgi:hypothetical protein